MSSHLKEIECATIDRIMPVTESAGKSTVRENGVAKQSYEATQAFSTLSRRNVGRMRMKGSRVVQMGVVRKVILLDYSERHADCLDSRSKAKR